jgi:flavodoxin
MTAALNRRELLAGGIGIAGATMMAFVASAEDWAGKRVLVAYLTRSGNTRVVAKSISLVLGADLFEIRTEQPYPENYFEMVAQAERERETGFEPPLAALVADIARYDVVFLGSPIWGQTAPSVLRSFLSKHDLSGKTLIPFITHGGYGLGNSLDVIRAHAPNANLIEVLTMEADQERRTVETVSDWLARIRTT